MIRQVFLVLEFFAEVFPGLTVEVVVVVRGPPPAEPQRGGPLPASPPSAGFRLGNPPPAKSRLGGPPEWEGDDLLRSLVLVAPGPPG